MANPGEVDYWLSGLRKMLARREDGKHNVSVDELNFVCRSLFRALEDEAKAAAAMRKRINQGNTP
jgi:hypothetical protein